jgi:hypothetical protein
VKKATNFVKSFSKKLSIPEEITDQNMDIYVQKLAKI